MFHYLSRRMLAWFAAFLLPAAAHAATLSYTGSFTQDDDLQFVVFTLGSPASVTIKTLSYAGGTNADGIVIPRGGFDPVLSLFEGNLNPSGALVDMNNDGGCPAVPMDSVTNACWDSLLIENLAAGTYTVALSQSDNLPAGTTFGDGFFRTGMGNFTGPAYIGGDGSFWDANPDQRTSQWAFDILIDGGTEAPEPGSISLLLGGALVFFAARRRSGRCA